MATQSSAPRDGKYPYGSDLFRRISNLETANAALAKTNRRLRADLQRLQKLAYLDPLTGLGNRRYFACCIDSELRRRGSNAQAVLPAGQRPSHPPIGNEIYERITVSRGGCIPSAHGLLRCDLH